MNLYEYLTNRMGRPISKLKVLSANKEIEGVVESVIWGYYQDNQIDIERSWVTIKWENNKSSYNTVDFMEKVTVVQDRKSNARPS